MATPAWMQLHALPDDWALNGLEFLQKDTAFDALTGPFNLTDESGNKLKDEAGNFLVAYNSFTAYPLMLHAYPDNFSLNDSE
jgi:hypothetical protein